MSVQDWHSYAARVTEQHQQRSTAPARPAHEPVQDLSSFGLTPVPDPVVETEPAAPVVTATVTTDVAPAPVAPAPVAPAPVAPLSSVTPIPVAPVDPAEVAPIVLAAAEVAPIVPVAAEVAPIVLQAAEAAPIVLAAAEAAPVVALASVVQFHPSNRPAAVDADLRPVMADRLAGDLADLTRVLLGVASTSAAPVVATGSPVATPGPVSAVAEPVATVEPVVPVELVQTFAPAPEVTPLVTELAAGPQTPHITPHMNEEPPTPAAPAPTVPVDVVLSELSFLDG